jgi:chromosome segregation ATPase
VFKYVLTGVVDSALDMAKPETSQPMRQAVQLELLDQQVRDLDQEIAEADHDHEELEKLDSSLDIELAQTFQVQEETESDYRQLTGRRRQLRREHEEAQDRIAEIDTLLARFQLLQQHYGSDHDRLAAVIEAGTLFALEDGEIYPICGADPAQHRPASACEGNIDEIVEAPRAETADLDRRSADLEERRWMDLQRKGPSWPTGKGDLARACNADCRHPARSAVGTNGAQRNQ